MPKYFFLKWYILNFRFNLAHLPHMLPGLHTYNKAENIGSVWERPNLKWVLFCVNICTNYAPNLWPNLTLGRSNTSCNIILQIALLHTFAEFGIFFRGGGTLLYSCYFFQGFARWKYLLWGNYSKSEKSPFLNGRADVSNFVKSFVGRRKKVGNRLCRTSSSLSK